MKPTATFWVTIKIPITGRVPTDAHIKQEIEQALLQSDVLEGRIQQAIEEVYVDCSFGVMVRACRK